LYVTLQVCEHRAAVDWDTAVAPPQINDSDTSLFVVETLGEVVSELECEELITPARREIDAERRVAAPATRVARRVTADQVSFVRSFIHSFIHYPVCPPLYV